MPDVVFLNFDYQQKECWLTIGNMTHLDYKIDDKSDHLLFTLNGQCVFEELKEFVPLVKSMAEKFGKTKILIDGLELTDTDIPALNRFFLGEKIAEVFPFPFKLAIAWPIEHMTRFAETVAKNRGGNICVFSTFSEAEECLLAH